MRYVWIVLLALSLSTVVYGQKSAAVRQLEQQRKEALADIEETNKLLQETAQTAKTSLNRLNLLSKQILSRKKVISLLNQELDEIEKDILNIQGQLRTLKRELGDKQTNYGKSMRGLYKRHSSQDKLLFILSAESFSQSMRRMRYLREYADWQKRQANDIVEKQAEISRKQAEMEKTRAEKRALLGTRQEESKKLESEEASQKEEVQLLNKRQKDLKADLQKKRRQAEALNRQIEKQIAEEIARAEGADAVCHGSTGKGNDQVRFELAIMHFAPDLKIITPWREWDIQSRDEEIDYAEAHHIPLKINRETNYSKDKNLWHLSHEGLDLEDPGNEPQYDKPGFLELGVSPKTAPDKSEFVELAFEKGVPVSLNGEKMKPAVLIAKLNEIGGRNGIGLYDVVENRLVGMKSRGVYETPGGTILYKAHEVLETLTLDKLTAHKKRELAITFGELVYDGQWFSPLRKALSAFVTSTQENVTGKVRLELYKGNMINAGVWSPYSLYREDIATFAAGGDYKQSDATGFISIYGLPTKVQAIVNNEKEGK